MKPKIKVNHQLVESNGWVTKGSYWNAMFVPNNPLGVKGCPCGRSQHSADMAVRDLLDRTNMESGTQFNRCDFEIV